MTKIKPWMIHPFLLSLMHPDGSDLTAYRPYIEARNRHKKQYTHHQHPPETSIAKRREHLLHHIQIECTYIKHDTHGKDQHAGIEHNRKRLIRESYPTRTITDEQEIFQLGGILLQQQVYAEHEDIERKRTDEQTH